MIGDFRVYNLPPTLPKGAPIEITYAYDASGRINASALDVTGNNEATAEIVRNSGMNEEEIVDAFDVLTDEYDIE